MVIARYAHGDRVIGSCFSSPPSPDHPITPSPSVIPWQSELLSSIPDVVHGLTRRVAALGRAQGNIGFSAPRDRDDAWTMRQHWCATLGLVPEHLVTLGQIHGRDVNIANMAHAGHGAKWAPGGASAQI